MTRDVNLISEAYLNLKKRLNEQAPQQPPAPVAAPAAQPQAPVQAGNVSIGNPQGQAAPVAQKPAGAPTVKATKEQEKAVSELLKAFGLPESVAPYLIQSLVEQLPSVKAQFNL